MQFVKYLGFSLAWYSIAIGWWYLQLHRWDS